MEAETEVSREQRLARHRQVAEPVVLEEDEEDQENSQMSEASVKKEEEEEDEVDEEERAKRRLELKQKALQRQEAKNYSIDFILFILII